MRRERRAVVQQGAMTMIDIIIIFINCDKMVGSQFEKGLGKLKAIAEG